MPTEEQPKIILSTEGIPTLYCNQGSFSISYNDIRVYLAEVLPKEIIANPSGDDLTQKAPRVEGKICLVFSPEFGRSLLKALASSVEKYERVYGPLRPEPTPEQITKALEQQ